MVARVVDASAIAAVLFGEPGSGTLARHLAASFLIAPTLIDFELANVCLKKIRRQPDRREIIWSGYRLRDSIYVETVEVNHTEVLQVAERTGLTAYDASYFWLARQLGLELVSLDKKLVE